VNRAHLETFVWVRWRLAVNQITRSGPGGAIVSSIFTALMVAGGALTLIAGFLVGFLALGTASPRAVMVVWDGAIVGFVFFWMVGLISEFQRSDALSLDRFLHLPVSPSGAFLINYLGSSLSLSLVLMLPAMTGLAAGLTVSRGPGMLVLFPLVAAFFLMMTAVTYQFRGWLASMMKNPRRRRTILTAVPVLFILAFQLPNLWNNLGPGARERREARAEARRVIATLDEELAAGRITREEYDKRRPVPPVRTTVRAYETTRVVNTILPPGWLAYGAEAAAQGRPWRGLAGVLGMALIGAVSLRRAYNTTLRLYSGDFDTPRRRVQRAVSAAPAGVARPAAPSAALVGRRLPWTSERASSVAVASFQSWMRAPEMKMTLLTPVIMLVVFSGMFTSRSASAPELLRPLAACGIAAFMLMLALVGPAGNQFGYDRAGFRAFVLSPVARRDVLLGKNLALLPFALVMMGMVIGIAQWFDPMKADHFAAMLVQLVPIYLVFCMGANLLSILAPLALKQGSGMPARHQGVRQFFPIVFMLVAPVPLALTLIPLGIEALLSAMNWLAWFPAFLVFGSIQAAASIWLYRLVLDWEGDLLQRREQEILDIVGSRAE
jgi:hypothetical protein